MNWISVKDRLPEKRDLTYLTYSKDIEGCRYRLMTASTLNLCFTSAVTHWMPLPEPPKEAK